MEEIKQVIVVRQDLKMGKGKLAVQVAHAAVEGYVKVSENNPTIAQAWLSQGQKKVVLKVDNLQELMEVFNKAKESNLPAYIIRDAGRTQLEPGTVTCIVIGPAPTRILDKITGKLKLL
ncbi:MAG: peptidyl-tRNA hydrolase [Thermoprotei archaeon]|nr:MAG: peptidyl-tRNA hydrolase [Thermoprotei archaeon]